jgi:sigma-E factor negative regulatory protein RseB
MRLKPLFSVGVGFIFVLAVGVAQAEGEVVFPTPESVASVPDEDAVLLLKRMAAAMQTTNYEGLLLHMRGGEARSMRVFHRYDAEHGEREHLLSLDGKPFEVIQDANGCTCVWPQARFMVVGQTPAFNGRLSTERFAETRTLSSFYTITRQDYARVGGMACRLVKLEPKDAYRFSYRLCIHESSAMLLNLEVFDGDRRLELSQFTQMRVQRREDADDMRLFTNIEGFRVVKDMRPAPAAQPNASFQTSWVATQLPQGYLLRSAELRTSPHTQKPLEQLIFSDGLGSVSVFIERFDSAAAMPPPHPVHPPEAGRVPPPPRGAMQRVVRDVDGYRLTAVGDAPEAAMRMMLDGMQPSSPRAKE